jgi:hypothetical protein
MRNQSLLITVSAVSLLLLMLMPMASAVELKVNASYDGSVGSEINTTWVPLRNSGGNLDIELQNNTYSGQTYSVITNANGYYQRHWRGLITWDTAAIPDGATITSATVSVFGHDHQNGLGQFNFAIIDATPLDKSAYVAGDYGRTTFTRMAGDIPYTSFNNEGWNEFTLNPSGLTTISKTGLTTFMFTHSADVDNSSLTWANDSLSAFEIRGLSYNSGEVIPFITINYIIPVTPVLTITANQTNVTAGTPTFVNFMVRNQSSGLAVSGATVTLTGVATGTGTTGAGGNTTISVNASSAGIITAAASMTGYTSNTTTVTANPAPVISTMDKIGIYQNGAWYLDRDGSGAWNAGDTANVFGAPGWTSVLGDWNGDGMTEEGIYKDGAWYLDYNGNGIWDAGIDKADIFGTVGWTPVVGNWNGDASGDKIGVYMDGAWYLDNDGSGTWNAGDRANTFGAPGWTPVVGNWNGDATGTKIGIYKDGAWYLDFNGNGVWDTGIDKADIFGTVGWTPVVGNWNGDATGDKIGIYKDGAWYLDNDGSGTWNAGDRANLFGTLGWTPIIGNWNGDATGTKIGVYMDGTWYLDYNGNGAWDAGIDKVDIFGVAGWTPVVGKWH